MDLVAAFQAIFALENYGAVPAGQIVVILFTMLFLHRLVRIKAESGQCMGGENRFILLPQHSWPGNIWGGLTLLIVLYRFLSPAFQEEFAAWLSNLPPVQMVNQLVEQNSLLWLLLSVFFPLPSTMWETVWRQLSYFLMLFALFLLELWSHPDIRESVWKKVSGTWRTMQKRWSRDNEETKTADGTESTEDPPQTRAEPQKDGEEDQESKKTNQFHRTLYEYDEGLSRYFLKEEYKWHRVLYPVVLLILLVGNAMVQSKAGLLLFPLYAITEFWMESAIPTRREFLEKRQQQDGQATAQDEFKKVVSNLQKKTTQTGSLFWPKIETRNYDGAGQIPRSPKPELEQTQEEKLIDHYITLCRNAGVEADQALAGPAKALLCGKSMVFSTRFYQDMDYSFYLPMLRVLQSGYRCLILTGDPINMQPIEDWLLNGRRYIIGDTAIWQMGEVGARHAYQPDVGYMTAEGLGRTKLLEQNSSFFEQVRLVLIVNASALLHKQLFGIMRLRKRLPERCAFAICNDNAEGMTDIYAHLLQTELNLVYPSTRPARQSYYLFCDEEERPGSDILECRQLELSRQLLNGNTKAIPKVRWYSRNGTPLKDIANLYGMLQSADEYDSPKEQAGKLVFGTDDANCPREDVSCVIVEDELYNPAELSVQFSSRGQNSVLVAIFSPYYYFRDYIRNNWARFYENHRKIAQTFPAYCMSERNAVLQMMWNMREERLDERDISAICALLGQYELEQRLKPNGQVDWLELAKVFQEYTGLEHVEYYLHYEHKFDQGTVLYEFWLEDVPDHCYDKKRPCYYTCTAFGQERRPLTQYSKIQLQQSYLPGQLLSLAGQCYEVKGLREDENALELSVRRSAQRTGLRTQCRQKRSVVIQQAKETGVQKECLFQGGGVVLCLKELLADTMAVTTVGYWTISGGRIDPYTPVASGEEVRHQFSHKSLLCLELVDKANRFTDTDDVMQCLMVELSELFRTIYAEYEHQLLVCKLVSDEQETLAMENFGQEERALTALRCSRFYIVEDSEEDLGLLDSVLMHIDRLLQIITEAEEWTQSCNGGNA